MNISSVLKDELYKFTEECKRETANKKLISRYIFKPEGQSTKEPEGSLNFIDSNKLYDYDYTDTEIDDKDLKDNPNIRAYFKYNSIAGRFFNKNVRVCDLPISVLEKRDCPICSISGTEIIESRIDKKECTTDGTIPLKSVFGKEYRSYKEYDSKYTGIRDDFLSCTGVLISVYAICKNDDLYYTHKIPSSDVSIAIMSSNYFDISFIDNDSNFSYYIIEVCKVCDNERDLNINSSVNFKLNSNDSLIITNDSDDFTDSILYSNRYFTKLSDSDYEIVSENNKKNIIITNTIFENRYIDKSQFIIWYTYTYRGSEYCMLIPNYNMIGFETKQNRVNITISSSQIPDDANFYIYCIYNKDESEYTEKTLPDVLKEFGISDTIISDIKMPDSSDELYEFNLMEYYPNYLKEKLESQCPTYYGKIERIYSKNIIRIPQNDKLVPCIRFEIPIKHACVMFFQNGKLLDPTEYFEGVHIINGVTYGSVGTMSIYINAEKLSEDKYEEFIKNSDNYYELDCPIYIVSTQTFFNEDVSFPLTETNKYIINGQKYSHYTSSSKDDNDIFIDDFGTKFVKDDNGSYLKDGNNFYLITSDDKYIKTYELIENTNLYRPRYEKSTNVSNDDFYYKVKSNEYIFPVNKRLDKEKIAIMVERMEQVGYLNTEAYSTNKTNYNFVPIKNNSKRFISGVYWKVIDSDITSFVLSDTSKLSKDENGNSIYIYTHDNESKNIQIECDGYGNPISYERAIYKYSRLLNNIKYYSEQSDRDVYILNDNGEYEKCKKDEKLAANFKDFNKIIKIRIANGEIIDCGFSNTDEYLDLIDAKIGTKFIEDTSGNYVYDEDKKIYRLATSEDSNLIHYIMRVDNVIDLNTIQENDIDGRIVAYNISNGYSQYFLNKDNDQFLSYVIPTQLIASENKLLAFMNGYLTDEFIIDKHLYYKLFDGNTILAFSDDQINKDIFKFIYDPNGDYIYDNEINDYRKITSDDDIITGDELVTGDSSNIVPRFTLICDEDGVEEFTGGSSISIDNIVIDPLDDTRYSKIAGTIYITNPGNYTLYQDIHGISYDDGIFTLSNDIDGCIENAQKMYEDFYMVPFDPKYMMLFINGRYISSDNILPLSNRRFALIGMDEYFDTDDQLEINEIFIYKYDYIDSSKYLDYYICNKDSKEISINRHVTRNVYSISDYLWDFYGELIKDAIDNKIFKNIIINPKDPGFHQTNNLIAMYEIFGKYVLNTYDIDSNFDLADEVRSYFSDLYDEDGRMRLELILDSINRKYQYGRYIDSKGL